MATLQIGPHDGLYYEYDPPRGERPTFVFVNALTGSTGAWQEVVGPRLRAAGYGTLCWNLRGQADSPFDPGLRLHAELISADLGVLLAQIGPPRPILCGLSIGGLYAARALLAGARAEALVLINTLRRPSARLDWVNTALLHAAAAGGIPLLLDLYLPLLAGERWCAAHRERFLTTRSYTPLAPGHGHYRLLEGALETDWEVPWERLTLPVLVVTGRADRVFYEPEAVAALAARIPAARRVDWDDVGHLPTLECPERLAETLAAFAAELG